MSIIFIDCMFPTVKEVDKVVKKALYVVAEIDTDGYKEILGFWLAANDWERELDEILTFYKYPYKIRRMLATTNGKRILPTNEDICSAGNYCIIYTNFETVLQGLSR